MKSEVRAYIRNCETCQQQKTKHDFPSGLLKPLPIPSKPWSHITMDFIEGLPNSNGFSTLWVVVDKMTKYSHFTPMGNPYTAKSIAQLFIKHIFKLHTLSQSTVSNRNSTFTSVFWRELFKAQGVQLEFSAAYHPQTDG